MKGKKSFYEIITNNLVGKWCDGIAIMDLSNDELNVDNIFNNNEKNSGLSGYPISLKEKTFSKVIETNYDQAVIELIKNHNSIISPKVSTDEIITFDGCRHIEYGGNVYCYILKNKILVNDKDHFDSFDDILNFGFISKKELAGKWLVF
ncbi:MAG: hypothetical protein ACERKN_01115 [Velocimicrobium sp.]